MNEECSKVLTPTSGRRSEIGKILTSSQSILPHQDILENAEQMQELQMQEERAVLMAC